MLAIDTVLYNYSGYSDRRLLLMGVGLQGIPARAIQSLNMHGVLTNVK